MPETKEYREFFLRETQVTGGSKPDQENGFPTKYLVKGVSVFNRFLAKHFPSEKVMKKFLESIAFKLNPEDTATTSTQGLVKKSSDSQAEARTLNPSANITLSVAPHQLPDVVLATDINDAVQGSPAEFGGLKLSTLRRTLTGGLLRKNFKLEINPVHSIEIDGATNKVHLKGDANAPGNNMHYGTNDSGTKGWYADEVVPWVSSVRLDNNFDTAANVTAPVTGGDQFRIGIPDTLEYKFKCWMPVLLDNANGARINVNYSAPVTNMRYSVKFLETSSMTYRYLAKKTAINGNDNFDTVTDGYIEIEGTILPGAAGLLSIEFGTKNGLAGLSRVEQGSYFIVERVEL